MDSVLEEVSSQFRKQIIGFLVLGLGLIMQFVGNFPVSAVKDITSRARKTQ